MLIGSDFCDELVLFLLFFCISGEFDAIILLVVEDFVVDADVDGSDDDGGVDDDCDGATDCDGAADCDDVVFSVVAVSNTLLCLANFS